METVTRDLKEGAELGHLPSGRFSADAAWLAFCVLAHNLARWVTSIGVSGQMRDRTTTERLRRRVFSMPRRLTRSVRQRTLHLPRNWPCQALFLTALAQLRAIT